MEPQAKRTRLLSSHEHLSDGGSDSDFDSDDEAECYEGLNVKEAVARLRSALVQLPSRSARRDCVLVQEWVKDLIIASNFSPTDKVVELLEIGLLQLLPNLLQAQHEHIVQGALEVVGALALHSNFTNEKLACCKQVVSTLTSLLESRRPSVMVATCHCLNDIMVSPRGCRACMDSAALENLMRLLCWITDHYLSVCLPLSNTEQGTLGSGNHVSPNRLECDDGESAHNLFFDVVDDVQIKELGELFVTVTQATSQLLAFSLTAPVASDILTSTLSKLQQLWRRMKLESRKQKNIDPLALVNEVHGRRQVLASLVARLAMEADFLSGYVCISRFTHADLQEVFPSGFFLEHWEFAPSLIRGGSGAGKQALWSCLKEVLWQASAEELLVRLISRFSACPPIPSDEVDPLNIFKDLQLSVGEPVKYGRDIRLVKSGDGSKPTTSGEHNYYSGEETSDHLATCTYVRIADCVKAFKLGYTVAVRGMEFRFPGIAVIADCLATALGQASVGANLYLTPGNEQGLATHYDDHCVLICQIYGHKHWSIYSQGHVLPRLYNSRCPVQQNASPLIDVLVDQGDWLYIPRGFAHEAHTCNQCMYTPADLTGSRLVEEESFSLHLTFGVEVESPFEWEGLIHMALHYFGQRRMSATANGAPRLHAQLSKRRVHFFIILLHIAVREVGKECAAFRKACTIAATIPQAGLSVEMRENRAIPVCSHCKLQDSKLQLSVEHLKPESFFQKLLSLFSAQASFKSAHEIMKNSLAYKNGDGLSWMAWFRHLPDSGEPFYSAAAFAGLRELLMETSEAGCPAAWQQSVLQNQFTSMKDEFLSEALYVEACTAFELVLGKYRDSRKKLINALLALHADFG